MNKARYFIIILLTIVILPGVQGYAQTSGTTPKGHLVIIGGGTRTTEVMQRFVDLAGGPKSEFLVISTAGLEEERGSGMVKELNALGVRKASWIAPTREQCNDSKYVRKVMKDVSGVFFTGGYQNRIVDTLGRTLLHEALKKMYMEGGVIGGTSAGAAMDLPQYVHIGIDEATALIVSNGRDIEVLGESNVMVVEPVDGSIKTDNNGHYGTPEMAVRLLISGDWP